MINPATGERLAYVPFSDVDDIDATVQRGQRAFEEWSQRPVEERIQPMFRYKALLEEHQDELAELLVKEHGNTIAEARGELRRGIENLEVACGIQSTMQAGTLPNAAPEINESAVGQPLGVSS